MCYVTRPGASSVLLPTDHPVRLLVAHLRRHALALAIDDVRHERVRRQVGGGSHHRAGGDRARVGSRRVFAAAVAGPAVADGKGGAIRARQVNDKLVRRAECSSRSAVGQRC